VSLYEIGQKVRLGKWPALAPFAAGLLERALGDGFDPLPLSPGAALAAALMDWDHRDPFDRLIAATALAEGLPVVSPDAAFDAVGVERIWA
jgi:PIN domain nuclease of toxin-antitoxin system